MKNQVIKKEWNEEEGTFSLKVANKWGVFEATSRCAPEDKFDKNIGELLCKYKIDIKILKAKAKAFNQRALGSLSTYNTIINAKKQNPVYFHDKSTASWIFISMLNSVKVLKEEAIKYKEEAEELELLYPNFVKICLTSKI